MEGVTAFGDNSCVSSVGVIVTVPSDPQRPNHHQLLCFGDPLLRVQVVDKYLGCSR